MNRWTGLFAGVIVAALIAMGCTSPQVADDDDPTDEEVAEDETPAEAGDHEPEPHEEADDADAVGVPGLVAVAEMYSGDGEHLGDVQFTQTEQGVRVEGRIESLGPTLHGFHVHEHGQCDPPDFESAGGHFNPEGHPHGAPDDPADQRHAGDFGNLEFDEDNVAEFSFVDDVITLGDGINDVSDKALIVHYEEDDLESQPTGDAGPRAGCGIIEVARQDVDDEVPDDSHDDEPAGGEEDSLDEGQ